MAGLLAKLPPAERAAAMAAIGEVGASAEKATAKGCVGARGQATMRAGARRMTAADDGVSVSNVQNYNDRTR